VKIEEEGFRIGVMLGIKSNLAIVSQSLSRLSALEDQPEEMKDSVSADL
jgi:hypothetical protein